MIPLNISRAEWREKTPLEKEAIRKSIVEDNDSDPNIDQYRAKIRRKAETKNLNQVNVEADEVLTTSTTITKRSLHINATLEEYENSFRTIFSTHRKAGIATQFYGRKIGFPGAGDEIGESQIEERHSTVTGLIQHIPGIIRKG